MFLSTVRRARHPEVGRVKKTINPKTSAPPKTIQEATPEEIARRLLATPPKKTSDWKFMKERHNPQR